MPEELMLEKLVEDKRALEDPRNSKFGSKYKHTEISYFYPFTFWVDLFKNIGMKGKMYFG